MAKLTPKQARFCQEYVIDLNASKAALRAGYTTKNSDSLGSQLLSKPQVASRIAELQSKICNRLDITAERVLAEFAKIAFADPRCVMSWGPDGVTLRESSDLTDDEAAIVSEVSQTSGKEGGSIKLKVCDKAAALTALGKHLALFTDKLDASVDVLVRFEEARGDRPKDS